MCKPCRDTYIIKTDSNGNELWSKTFVVNISGGVSVKQTSDAGYILLADIPIMYGPYMYLVKTDANGNELWNRSFGVNIIQSGFSVAQATDGGYILLWFTATSTNHNSDDMYIVKTDDSGNELWSRTFGGNNFNWGKSVIQTSDGGYASLGTTSSFGLGGDMYFVKTDPNGNVAP